MNHERLLKALARQGLDVHKTDGGWQVRLASRPNVPYANILLPETLPVEDKAFFQLANLASIEGVTKACASPDFHPGDAGVAIGSIIQTTNPIPAAVGDDICCGMRLHVADLTIDRFMEGRNKLVELLKGDYFLGTRDVAQTVAVQKAMFRYGLPVWWAKQKQDGWKHGMVAGSDHTQLIKDVSALQYGVNGHLGDIKFAPEDLVTGPDDKIIRDDGLGTIGGGNHFVEFQVVDEILDRHAAYDMGLKVGQVGFMVHTGSRFVGKYIGQNAQDRAKKAWIKTGRPFPVGNLFPVITEEDREEYLTAEATAANYGWVNRMLVAEIARLRMRQVFGKDLECPLVTDIPHNITLADSAESYIQRKGACPADHGNWLLIPGSMGTASYVCQGLGNEKHLWSASHGAGRSTARINTKRIANTGLEGVDCITLREERRVEECPASYKPIQPVIDSQVQAGILSVVAKMKPLLTFKA
jgi:tRNA-splicing ligase RtcB